MWPINKFKNFSLELSKYLERKEELELMKIKKQQKDSIRSFGPPKNHVSLTEPKKKLELLDQGISVFTYCLVHQWHFKNINYLLLLVNNLDSEESTIVSRYVSSMKKKPSLQGVMNRAKNHPYQRSVSSSDNSMSQDISSVPHSSSDNKVFESV